MRLQIKLKEVMQVRKLIQTQLSEMSNVTRAKISLLCNNKLKELNMGIIERLAAALEVEDISLLMELKRERIQGI